MRAIVLAAGCSTRLAAITNGLPKPLVEVAGEPVLAHNVRWLGRAGVKELWINLHYRPDSICGVIGDGSRFGVKISYVREKEILGTAGAVRNIAGAWSDRFLVVYGDNLISVDLEKVFRRHAETRALVSVGVFDLCSHPHTGIAGGRVRVDGEGRVTAFAEGTNAAESSLVNAGLYLVEPELVGHIPPGTFYDFGHDLFPLLLRSDHRIFAHVIDGYCLGIDTPDAYRRAAALVREGKVSLA